MDVLEEADAAKYITFFLKNGRWFVIELFAGEDDNCLVPDSWDSIPSLGRTSQRTDSSVALATIKSWISACIINHSPPQALCESPECPLLPTRMIDVGLCDGIIKLVEPRGIKSKYVCLSHTWGLTQIVTTTKLTFEERKSGIAWEDLSKTFQDAISLTRNLGIAYIWIDSLCIIQDDPLDWEIESAKMASVYSNGHLTIATTRSADGNGGLFSRTEDFKVSGKIPDGDNYCLYFRESIDHHIEMTTRDGHDDVPECFPSATYYPLLTRAWIYQERMLSTRVLHFGRYEIFFECKSDIRCECGTIEFGGSTGHEVQIPLIKIEYADTLWKICDGDKRSASNEIQYQSECLWRTMVSSYTALLLTKSKDRLPAISGLAKQLAAGRKSTYLAGLWEDSLNDDLLWTSVAKSKEKKPRPYPRYAPTWSWASVEAAVHYSDEILFTDFEGDVHRERPPLEHSGIIQKCEVRHLATDPFGLIAHGALTISGLITKGTLECEADTHDGMEQFIYYVSFDPNTRLPINTDYLLEHESSGQTRSLFPVSCLRMSLITGGKDKLVSLILKSSTESYDCFERIGTLTITRDLGCVDPKGGIFRAAEVQTVVII